MNLKLKEMMDKLAKCQEKMGKILEQAGPDLDFKKVTEVNGTDTEKAAAFRAINDECSVHQKSVDEERQNLAAKEAYEKRSLIARVAQPSASSTEVKAGKKEPLSLADSILKAAGIDPEEQGRVEKVLKEHYWNKEVEVPLDVNLKTLMDTTAWVPETLRTGRLVDKAARPIQVTDLIPAGQTGQSAVVYMEETTLTENAAEIAEAGTYGENAYALTERSETVRKVAAWLPVTDEQLEDVPQVRGYVNNRYRCPCAAAWTGRSSMDRECPYLTGISTSPVSRRSPRVGFRLQAGRRALPRDAAHPRHGPREPSASSSTHGFREHPVDEDQRRRVRLAPGEAGRSASGACPSHSQTSSPPVIPSSGTLCSRSWPSAGASW